MTVDPSLPAAEDVELLSTQTLKNHISAIKELYHFQVLHEANKNGNPTPDNGRISQLIKLHGSSVIKAHR